MSAFPDTLLHGYARFNSGALAVHKSAYQDLAENGQSPKVMVISCSDSRAMPEVIFDAAPGDIFTVRNVANLVTPSNTTNSQHGVAAALEFAVLALGVGHVLVMGHALCGGIKASLDPDFQPLSDINAVGEWIDALRPLAAEVIAEPCADAETRQLAMEHKAIAASVDNLRSFAFVKERETAGTLHLHGAWFDIATGELWIMNPETGDFVRPDMPA